MKEKIDLIFEKLKGNKISEKEAKEQVLELVSNIPSTLIESFDVDEWLGEEKDIWNHPIISDRNENNSYEVSELIAEFTNKFFKLT